MNEHDTVHGPYDTSGEALRDAAHVYDASRRQERRGTMGQVNEGLLLAALASAGVEIGQFDRGIAGWLAGYEPETVQTVIGWVQRAHAAGNLGANWAHHVAASRAQDGAGAAGAPDAADGPPWRVYGLPRPGDGGRPWLVDAFATKRRAEQFAATHPEHGPLTVTYAGESEPDADAGTCGRCGQPFDPTDTRFDGRAEERSLPGYCRGCVDRCHDSEDAFHVCVICRPTVRGQRDGGA